MDMPVVVPVRRVLGATQGTQPRVIVRKPLATISVGNTVQYPGSSRDKSGLVL